MLGLGLYIMFLCIVVLTPINGGFSQWSEWDKCTKGCNGGEQFRYRQCNQPTPKNGGTDCDGKKVETKKCNTDKCPG